jgi:hypothetical protein
MGDPLPLRQKRSCVSTSASYWESEESEAEAVKAKSRKRKAPEKAAKVKKSKSGPFKMIEDEEMEPEVTQPEGETTLSGRKRNNRSSNQHVHVNEDGSLRNMGAVGNSSERQMVTAVEHFRMFCHYTPNIPELDELRREDVTIEFVGAFATFLFLRWTPQDPQMKVQEEIATGSRAPEAFVSMSRPKNIKNYLRVKGALSYLSQVRQYLESRFSKEGDPFLLFERGGGQWYKRIRTKLITEFVDRCIRDGVPISEAAPDISLQDLELLCELLYLEGSPEALEIRSLVIADFLSIGRISDSAMFGWVNLEFDAHNSCLRTQILARKTGDLIPCSIFPSSRSWRACLLNSIGCQLIKSSADNKWIFPRIPKDNAAAVVNKMLKRILDAAEGMLPAGLSTHSLRRGSANEAISNALVALTWVILKGGWDLKGKIADLLHFC